MHLIPSMLCLLAVALLCHNAGAEEWKLYVAPNGHDGWSGALPEPNREGTDGPLASLPAAQAALRQRKQAGPLPGPVTVFVRGGVYELAEPLVFRPEDSGTAAAPITYAAYPGERPVFRGGRRLTGWKPGPGQTWTTEIPEVRDGTWYFYQLFVNGERRTRARSPNEGFFRVAGLVDVPAEAPWHQGVDRFRFEPGDLKNWEDLSEVEAVVFHSWNTSRLRLAAVDEQEQVVTFTGSSVFRPNAWEARNRYYLENCREFLDAPGEWYLDRKTGVLTYWPLPGETLPSSPLEGGVEIIAPALGQLVRWEGQPELGLWVEHLRLQGLSFQYADWSLGPRATATPRRR